MAYGHEVRRGGFDDKVKNIDEANDIVRVKPTTILMRTIVMFSSLIQTPPLSPAG